MGRDRINEWAALSYYNPRTILRRLVKEGGRHKVGGRSTPPPNWPSHQWNTSTEFWDAALVARGLQEWRPELNVRIAPFHQQDYDFVLRWGTAEMPYYSGLQLKVLVSSDVNPTQSLDGLIRGLKKYADADDLSVAVKIDRSDVDLNSMRVPELSIGALWCFGQRPENPEIWYLYGDCLEEAQFLDFRPFD